MQPDDANKLKTTFPKEEHLCSEVAIEQLLHKHQKFFSFPLKCFYDFVPAIDEKSVNQVVISVPKRYFKHAVDRNRVKRLIREAYRRHQHEILDPVTLPQGRRVHLCICYISREILPYQKVENKIIEVLQRLSEVD